MLTEVEKHPNEYLVTVGFQGNALDGVMYGKHAYQVKKLLQKAGRNT